MTPSAQPKLLTVKTVIPDENETPAGLLARWLRRQLPDAAKNWLDGQLDKLGPGYSERDLHIALGMAPRRLGRENLRLSDEDLRAARSVRPGWDGHEWSVDQAARILLLCRAAEEDRDFPNRFADLCRSADAAEAVALYRGLPLYPWPERLERQAAEGVRTNMRAVFEAVAHRNPYPCEHFDENRWNQMVLKAVFIGSALHPIQGLDDRNNAELALILCDYAHERWSAGRAVTPELWRCVGRFADTAAIDDLRRVVETGSPVEVKAAALALAASDHEGADAILWSVPAMARDLADGGLTWQSLTAELEA